MLGTPAPATEPPPTMTAPGGVGGMAQAPAPLAEPGVGDLRHVDRGEPYFVAAFTDVIRARPSLLIALLGGLMLMCGSLILFLRRPTPPRHIDEADDDVDDLEDGEFEMEELRGATDAGKAHALPSRLVGARLPPANTKYATLDDDGDARGGRTSQAEEASFDLDLESLSMEPL